MAERTAEVLSSGGGTLRVRLIGSACAGCGGCGGGCSAFGAGASGELSLPAPVAMDLHPGERVRVELDDAALRAGAWRGYGTAWLGLLAGAAAGRALAWSTASSHADLLTLAGLLSGTFVAVAVSKRRPLEPRLHVVRAHTPSVTTSESTTP